VASWRRTSDQPRWAPVWEVRTSLPEAVPRREWLAARKQLLAREKELTRQHDALNAAHNCRPQAGLDQISPDRHPDPSFT
jgi:hypothetical protein